MPKPFAGDLEFVFAAQDIDAASDKWDEMVAALVPLGVICDGGMLGEIDPKGLTPEACEELGV